jgi:hypothetical protein
MDTTLQWIVGILATIAIAVSAAVGRALTGKASKQEQSELKADVLRVVAEQSKRDDQAAALIETVRKEAREDRLEMTRSMERAHEGIRDDVRGLSRRIDLVINGKNHAADE